MPVLLQYIHVDVSGDTRNGALGGVLPHIVAGSCVSRDIYILSEPNLVIVRIGKQRRQRSGDGVLVQWSGLNKARV